MQPQSWLIWLINWFGLSHDFQVVNSQPITYEYYQYSIFMKLSVLTKSPCSVPTLSPCSCSLIAVGRARKATKGGRTTYAMCCSPEDQIMLHPTWSSCSCGHIAVRFPIRRARKAASHVLLTYQAQSRTTIPSKSGDGSHILRLTGTATAMQPVKTNLGRSWLWGQKGNC